jgi:hypothetical protein
VATVNLTAGDMASGPTALVANTVDTINFSLFTPYIEVSTDGSATMAVTVDGTTPAVGGPRSYPIPASMSQRTIRLGPALGRNPSVKLISGGTPTYTVTAVTAP